MSKKIFLCVLFLLFGAFSLFAQENRQWEYLIVSVSTFGDKKALSVPEKWMGIRQGNIGFSQQTLTQNEFDRLGMFGWELVGIDDRISEGGTASKYYVFKRIYSFSQSAYEKEQQKMLIEKLSKSNPNEPEVVDLDKVESIAKQTQINNQVAEKLEQKLKSIDKFKIVEIKSNASVSTNYQNVKAEITFDGTKALLKDGNKFRSSEVKEFIRQVAEEVYKTVSLQPRFANDLFFEDNIYNQNGNGTFIQIKIVVNISGKYVTLAEGKVQGYWDGVKNY